MKNSHSERRSLREVGDVCRFVDVVEFTSSDRLPVVAECWTPPVDLVGARCADNLHLRRPIRKIAAQRLVNVEVLGRGVKAGEDDFLVAVNENRHHHVDR